MEERIDMLLSSYSLEELIEQNDITEEIVLEILINRGLVKLEDYFEYD